MYTCFLQKVTFGPWVVAITVSTPFFIKISPLDQMSNRKRTTLSTGIKLTLPSRSHMTSGYNLCRSQDLCKTAKKEQPQSCSSGNTKRQFAYENRTSLVVPSTQHRSNRFGSTKADLNPIMSTSTRLTNCGRPNLKG